MSSVEDLSSDDTDLNEEVSSSEKSEDGSSRKQVLKYAGYGRYREAYYEATEFQKYKVKSVTLQKLIKALKPEDKAEMREAYFGEGIINSDDVALKINDMEDITFPIRYETAEKLIDIATLASFGHGEQTKRDKNVRDTYMIPKEKLNVTIKKFDGILKDIKMKLSLNENSHLEAHLHNMLIYKKGQHFDYHQDTEKMDNMVATLVIALPSAHIGGNLVIKHLKKSHVFSSEMIYGDSVKYVAFYSDCHHKVEKVKDGFRIVLTYNLVMCDSLFKSNVFRNEQVVDILRNYFNDEEKQCETKKLIYLFDHSYTRKEVKFSVLKGHDLQTASALLCAARELNLVVRLVLADIQEVWDGEAGDLCEMEVKLESWKDENDQPLEYKEYPVSQDDICWLKHNNSLKPYHVDNSGYTGNEGITEERWYKRAAVILWTQSSDPSMQFELNFDGELKKLKTLLKNPDNLKSVRDIMEKADKNLFRGLKSSHNDEDTIEIFIKLAIYLKDPKEALKICERFSSDLFDCSNSKLFFELKGVFGQSWCLQLLNESGISKRTYSNELLKFLSVLKENDHMIIEQILKDQMTSVKNDYSSYHFERYGVLLRAALEIKYFNYVKDILKAVISLNLAVQKLAQFYMQHCMDIPEDVVETFKESVVSLLQENISRYRDAHSEQLQWVSKINFGHCKCQLCNDMTEFLKRGGKSKQFAIVKQKRQHLLGCFEKQNRNFFSMTVKTKGSPHRLVVEKKIDFVYNVDEKLSELEKFLRSITKAHAETVTSIGHHHQTVKSETIKRSIKEEDVEVDSEILVKKQRF